MREDESGDASGLCLLAAVISHKTICRRQIELCPVAQSAGQALISQLANGQFQVPPSEWTLGIKANTLEECHKRGLVFRQSAPLLARPSGLLLRTASAGLLSAYSENGMLVGDSRSNFRASAVVSSRLSRDSPWSCRTDDRGLEELASRIEAVVFRGGGRCSCSHARGLRSDVYRGTYPLGATSRLWFRALISR